MSRHFFPHGHAHSGAATITAGACALAICAQALASQTVTLDIPQPFLDRWNYPFNQTPGTRWTAPVFSPYLETDFFPDFDQRDAQFHVAFKTDLDVQPGLGAAAYTITSATVTVMTATNNSFKYSLTSPMWQWYLPPTHPEFICPVEADPCPPGNTVIPTPALKLFGVGFRNGFDALTYQENTPYSPFGAFGKGHRTTHAIDFDSSGDKRDVSNNIDGGFNPNPFALGTTDAVNVGDPVPVDTAFIFEIDVIDPHNQQYLREGLDLGILHFMVATLHITEQETSGGAPEFYCKEHPFVDFGFANAAGLHLTVEVSSKVGDLDGNGVVNVFDLLILLAAWGQCPQGEPCPADLDGNGVVNVFDLLMLLANWG